MFAIEKNHKKQKKQFNTLLSIYLNYKKEPLSCFINTVKQLNPE